MDSLVNLFGRVPTQSKSEKMINRVQSTKKSVANGMLQLEGELDQALKDKEKKKREYKMAIMNKDTSKKEIIGRSILELERKIRKLQIGLQSVSAHQSTLDTVHYTHMISGLGSEVLELTKNAIPDIDDVEEMNDDMIGTRAELDTLFVAMSGPSVESDLKQSMGDLDNELTAELEEEQDRVINPRLAQLDLIKIPAVSTPSVTHSQSQSQSQSSLHPQQKVNGGAGIDQVQVQNQGGRGTGGPRKRVIV